MPEFQFDLSERTARGQVTLEFAEVQFKSVAGAFLPILGLGGHSLIYDTPLK